MSRPLVVTGDPALAEALTRLCAAAGVTPDLVDEPTRALAGWAEASVVLVGPDLVGPMAATSPPRRRGVHVISAAPVLDHTFRDAVTLGVEGVAELPHSDQWLLEVLGDAVEMKEALGVTIGVVGGSGGAGATTFACALALEAAVRGHTALLDLDLLGPGADTVLGTEDAEGVRWSTIGQTTGRISARSFREALPRLDGPGVLTWTPGRRRMPPAFAVREVMSAAIRGHNTVVVDLPRHHDPVAEEIAARCTHLVLVVRADLTGITAGLRQAQQLRDAGPVRVLVRGPESRVAEVEKALGMPVLTSMTDQRGLTESVDLGLGPVRSRRNGLAKAAREVLSRLTDAAGRGTA